MKTLLLLLGVLIIGAVFVDALWTTVAAAGGGPLTTRLARGLWGAALRLHRRSGRHRLLALMGPVILMSAILLWIALLWAGYLLVFSAGDAAGGAAAVVHASTGAPASFWERVYFTGYTISTLGLGDYVPRGDAWRVATALASLSGLFLVTLSITYLVPVLSAVAAKRQIAALVADLGMTPAAILERAWDDEGRFALGGALTQLAPMIELHAQRHLAYPVLHFFHSRHAREAVAPRLAALDEALLVIAAAALREGTSVPLPAHVARQAIGGVLKTLDTAFIRESETAPPLDARHEDAAALRAAADNEARRRLLLAFVRDDGWTWDDVVTPYDDHEM